MLVLRLLADEESYGWELVGRLQQAGLTDIATGTVYPVLSRLEREKQVSSRLVASTWGRPASTTAPRRPARRSSCAPPRAGTP